MNVTNADINENLILVNPKIGLIAGRFQITHSTLGLKEEDIPPSELSSLGSMCLFDKKRLSTGVNIRSSIKNLLDKKGIATGGASYALTESEFESVTSELLQKESDFNHWRRELIDDYEQLVADWANSYPKYAKQIRQHAKPKEYLEEQIRFEINASLFQIGEQQNEFIEKTNKRFADSLPQATFNDTAKFLAKILKNSSERKVIRRISINNIVNTLIPKLRTYEFISPSVGSLAKYLDEITAKANSMYSSLPKPELVDKDYEWFVQAIAPIVNGTTIDELLELFKKDSKPNSHFVDLF